MQGEGAHVAQWGRRERDWASAETSSRAAAGAVSKISVFLSVVRRAGPHLVEATLIPTALFYCFLVLVGLPAAYGAALLWSYAALSCRLLRGRPVPPLLVLGVIGITIRTSIAMASGSSFVYFAQPIMTSLVMSGVFLVSVIIGRPLIERLALEFWPLTPEMVESPVVADLFRGLTFLWSAVNLAIAATTFALLIWLPLPAYVAVKQATSLVLMGAGIAITIDWSVRIARREGLIVRPALINV
jgi:hypothetical protein